MSTFGCFYFYKAFLVYIYIDLKIETISTISSGFHFFGGETYCRTFGHLISPFTTPSPQRSKERARNKRMQRKNTLNNTGACLRWRIWLFFETVNWAPWRKSLLVYGSVFGSSNWKQQKNHTGGCWKCTLLTTPILWIAVWNACEGDISAIRYLWKKHIWRV